MRDESRTSEFADELADRYPALDPLKGAVAGAVALLAQAFDSGGKLLVCGNGGSAADADHIVGELMKGFALKRPLGPELRSALAAQDPAMGARMADALQLGLPAIALAQHAALLSAFSNDADPALAYAQQVLGYGRPGDVLWAISTSGNSPNVLCAAVAARALGLKVIGMTGRGGGALAARCDILLAAPETETYKVQELHLPIYHAVCLAVEAAFFGT